MSLNKLDNNEKNNIGYMIALITQLGISMIVPIFLCGFAGIFINKYIDKPILVLFAFFFGCAVGFRNAYILLKRTFEKDLKKEQEELQYFKNLEEARMRRLKAEGKDKNN